MTKEKQIDEMARVLKDYTTQKHIMASHIILEDYAEQLYNAGYRKASEVAREIFEELEKAGIFAYRYPIIAELKKKYEESEKDNGN